MNGKQSRLCGLSIVLASLCGLAHADLLADPLGPVPKEVIRGAVAVAPQTPAPVSSAPLKVTTASTPSASAPPAAPSPVPQHAATAPTPTPTPTPAPTPAQVPPPQRPPLPLVDRTSSSEAVIATRTNVVTLRQLDALRSQNALLSEMVKAAEFKAKLSGQQAGTASQSNGSAPSSAGPQVVSVIGTDDKLTAVINLGDGSTIKVRDGAPVPGVGKVKSISLEEVMVTTKSGPVSLPFTPRNNFPGAR